MEILEMIKKACRKGETLHYKEITERVLDNNPDWKHGRTPEASIRRTLNYNSDAHGENASFRREGNGKYTLIK